MRLAHEAGEEDPDEVRGRMAELALRFPGALREIDELEIQESARASRPSTGPLRGEGERADWMVAVGLFHASMRGALCAKRWLAGRKHVDAAMEQGFLQAAGQLAFPDEAREWQSELARIASPPHGKVTSLVFERIARQLGTTSREARRLVFGPGRRERQRV